MSDRNRENQGIEAPGPIDRALDRDRDDRIDVLEGTQGRQVTGTTAGSAGMATTGNRGEFVEGTDREVHVPVVEEQLQVGKREVELGEVEVRRRVVEEQQSVPVTLRREEVHVQEVDTPDRPVRPGEDVFEEGTIRVAVRGEEAVVAKETVVTGEVVVEKDVTTEERTITDTVRRTEVDYDENYRQARADFQAHHASWSGAQGTTFEEHEPHYRTGFMAGADQRYQGRTFEEVEPELRREHTAGGGTDVWDRLREQLRTGFNRARR